MAGNRAAAEAVVLKGIEALLPGSQNVRMYRERFAKMSDTEFDHFIEDLQQGKAQLAIIAPNFGEPKLNVERNLDLAEKWGYNFFERLWITPNDGSPKYLSPVKYLVIDLPLRRQAQLLTKKISIPEDNKSIDDLTGQVMGKSKGSKISFPEIQVMASLGLDQSLTEMIKWRGGDVQGYRAMNDSISKSGGVSLKAIEPFAGGVESTKTLKTFLTCMHFEVDL